jgi:hypothetical protein
MAPPNVHSDIGQNAEMHTSLALKNFPSPSSSLLVWASVNPSDLGVNSNPYAVSNLVQGQWKDSKEYLTIPHPLDKDAPPLFTVPSTQIDELDDFYVSLRSCPKSGLHNPLKNPERYVQLGEISRKAAAFLNEPEVSEFFAQLILTCVPKSHAQAIGEVRSPIDCLSFLLLSSVIVAFLNPVTLYRSKSLQLFLLISPEIMCVAWRRVLGYQETITAKPLLVIDGRGAPWQSFRRSIFR